MGGKIRRREIASGRGTLHSAGWGRIHDRLYAQVRAWLSAKVANKHDAKDLAQQVFVKLAQASVPDDPKAYMWGVARNLLFQYRRRKKKERRAMRRFRKGARRDSYPPYMPNSDGSQEGDPKTQHDGGVEALLDDLPAKEVQLLRMRFSQGLTVEQMARKLGCSEQAVYKRLERVIQRLREKGSHDADATLQ